MGLDDSVAAKEGKEVASRAGLTVQNDPAKAGLVVNLAKSKWEPSQHAALHGLV